MLKIAIDVDAVLSDILTPILENFNQRTGSVDTYSLGDIVDWDFNDGILDINKEVDAYLADPDCVLSTPQVEDAKFVLDKLYDKYFITVATCRPKGVCEGATLLWLKKNQFKYHEIVYSRGKKANVLNSHVLIDDYHKYLENFLTSGGEYGILFKQPWSDKAYLFQNGYKKRIFTVNSWLEVPNLMERIENLV